MIYITGDTHNDFSRFSSRLFPEQKQMTKKDFVIILGDFGGILRADPANREEKYWLDWLEEKNFTTLFLDGNHENYDRLDSFPFREWNGGKVQEIRPSIFHLMRGQTFRMEGNRFFVFGGAASHDIEDGIFEADDPMVKRIEKLKARGYPEYQDKRYRVNHVNWWARELPDEEEMQEGLRNLEAAGWDVDFILTHCLPTSLQRRLGKDDYQVGVLTEYLETIRARSRYAHWFCGHYHMDLNLSERERVLYHDIVRIV